MVLAFERVLRSWLWMRHHQRLWPRCSDLSFRRIMVAAVRMGVATMRMGDRGLSEGGGPSGKVLLSQGSG